MRGKEDKPKEKSDIKLLEEWGIVSKKEKVKGGEDGDYDNGRDKNYKPNQKGYR